MDLAMFLVGVGVAMLDPIMAIAPILAGALCQRIWPPLAIAAAWPLILSAFFASLGDPIPARYLPPHVVGSLLWCLGSFGIAQIVRRRRNRSA